MIGFAKEQRPFVFKKGKHAMKYYEKPCGIHFSKPGHSLQDIQAIAFEKVFREDPIFRKERESYWINKYQAIEHGANLKC